MAKEYIEPMKPIIEQIMSNIRTQQEDAIMRAVCDCGIVVDKERLVQALTDARAFYEEGYRAAMNAADVVEVVRCKDCKHRVDWHEEGYSEDAGMCIAAIQHIVAPNHFCSYGERSDNDAES